MITKSYVKYLEQIKSINYFIIDNHFSGFDPLGYKIIDINVKLIRKICLSKVLYSLHPFLQYLVRGAK